MNIYPPTQPGIVVSEQSVIEQFTYTATITNQVLDINTSAVTIIDGGNYQLLIDGSALTFVYIGSGSVLDFNAKLVNFINQYGYFWATVQSATTIRLTSKLQGSNTVVQPGTGMTGATVTLVTPSVNPVPLTPGTLLWYDLSRESVKERNVTTYNIASIQAGFDAYRHCAGMLIADNINAGINSPISSSRVRCLRRGLITASNYGALLNRTSTVRINDQPGNTLLPSGAVGGTGFGIALTGNMANAVLADNIINPGAVGVFRISLL